MAGKPGEHKTVQARILGYAEEIGWSYVPRAEAEKRRGFDHSKETPAEQASEASPYFDDLLDAQVRRFNPKYAEGPGALVGELRHLHSDIAGNRDFLAYLRNARTFYDREAGRELNTVLIDYENRGNNVFEVTEEVYSHNGKYGTREDVVFLINGIPVLVIECKNATKDEAIALGVDQVRRYHAETPEMFVPQMVFTATEAIGFAYGVTWNLIRRNIFNWKHEEKGNLEAKVKSFCSPAHVLTLLKDYILFAEKDEELQKFILRQHQTTAVEKVVARCLTAPAKSEARRGLVWHTQGSGKTFTMIKAAELLFKAAGADKPDSAGAHRPQRAGRPDAAEFGDAGSGEHPARAQHRAVEQAAEERLPRDHRLDDPQVSGDARGLEHAVEHLRDDRRSPSDDRR